MDVIIPYLIHDFKHCNNIIFCSEFAAFFVVFFCRDYAAIFKISVAILPCLACRGAAIFDFFTRNPCPTTEYGWV